MKQPYGLDKGFKSGSEKLKGRPRDLFWRGQPLGRTFET